MNRQFLAVALSLALMVGAALLLSARTPQNTTQPGYPVERTVRYSFTVQNESARPLPTATFRTFAPVVRTPTQELVGLQASHPFEAKTDALGNRVLHFTLNDLPPNGRVVVRITANLRLADTPNRVASLESRGSLLSPSRMAPTGHPRIKDLARSLNKGHPGRTVHAIHQWAVENVTYQGYLAEDRGALYALKEGKGDCTEAMSLVLALSRASGIPALGVAGFPTTRNQVLRPEGFHNWAMTWPGKAFRETDPVNERLAPGLPGYIAFRLFDPEVEGGTGLSTQSFFHTEQGSVTIRMNG